MKRTQNPPTGVLLTPADLLRAAAQHIRIHGWHRGQLYDFTTTDTNPPACALGAIHYAGCGTPDAADFRCQAPDHIRVLIRTAVVEFTDYLLDHEDLGDPLTEDIPAADTVVGDWNDEEHRTADDVIAALEAAATDWDRRNIAGGVR